MKKMLEYLEKIDQDIFVLLNSFHTENLDSFMMLLSNKFSWIPLYIILLVVFFKKTVNPKKFLLLLSFIAISIFLSDFGSVHFFKNVFLRYRPCHNELLKSKIFIIENCGGKYGFISSHAANTFCIATISSLIIKHKKTTLALLVWATTIAYSRIYLGKHYPSDVIFGAMYGTFIGFFTTNIYLKITKKWQPG